MTVPWEVTLASLDGRAVTDGRGRKIEINVSLRDIARCDAVLVPGFVPDADGLPPAMPALGKTAEWIRRQQRQ